MPDVPDGPEVPEVDAAGVGDEHRVFSVNLITATRLWGVPSQRVGFLLSRSPDWLSRLFDEPSLEDYFKTFNFLHTARWMALGRFPHLSPDQPREAISTRWVLFMANFDGDWDAYFPVFMEAMGEGVYDIWGRSVGYPGFPAPGRAYRLVDWLDTRIVPSQHYYAAYPHATANDVRTASRVRRELRSAALDLRQERVPEGTDVGPRLDDLARRLRQCLGPVGRPAAGWVAPPTSTEGSIEAVVAVFPVLPGHEEEVRGATAAFGDGPSSPFFRIPGTHFARMVLLHRDEVGLYPDGAERDGLASGGRPNVVLRDRLRNSYLVVAADFDGVGDPRAASERFFQTLYRSDPAAVESVWSHCWGYATVNDEREFSDLAWRCRRPILREYLDYGDESLASVLAALSGHAGFVELVAQRGRSEAVAARHLLNRLDG
jgi:hypothetical protein